ncbi:hypothetical protein [Aureimonas leprariae]|uniref:hypothetical protein n=1 Tax=Plantimonas leprariae TaxID=2615207 RepID=UPI0013873047|nr:hypothetical protein [Aureimonas leprariae]
MIKLDDRYGLAPNPMPPPHETNLIVLARFGIACTVERRLTALGRQLVDEGAVR